MWINPAAGASRGAVESALFNQAGVASVQPVSGLVNSFESLMSSFLGVLYIVAFTVSLLAFLITYNSTSINVDERAREIATMFAFGLPVGTATRMAMQQRQHDFKLLLDAVQHGRPHEMELDVEPPQLMNPCYEIVVHHLPMQKLEKILSRISSSTASPIICLR